MSLHEDLFTFEPGHELLSLFSRDAFGDVDFAGTDPGGEDPKRVLPDPDEELDGLREKTSRIASLILNHKSIAGMLGMLSDENDRFRTHEKLVLGESSPLERVQWRAWKEGCSLPRMKWQFELDGSSSPQPLDWRRDAREEQGLPSFAQLCKAKALRLLYAEELDPVQRGTGRPSRATPQPPSLLPSQGTSNGSDASPVTATDVANFEVHYPALCPLLSVQARIVASATNTVAKRHLGTECELQERRCALHLARAYEEQLRVVLSRLHAQAELIRHNCEVIRGRADAMSIPFDVGLESAKRPYRGLQIRAGSAIAEDLDRKSPHGHDRPPRLPPLAQSTAHVSYIAEPPLMASSSSQSVEASPFELRESSSTRLPIASPKFRRHFTSENRAENPKRMKTSQRPAGQPASMPDRRMAPPRPPPTVRTAALQLQAPTAYRPSVHEAGSLQPNGAGPGNEPHGVGARESSSGSGTSQGPDTAQNGQTTELTEN